MVCQMAMDDIGLLAERGIAVTPEEIIRLNAVGLRVASNPSCADVVAAPRIGWAGAVAIHQPTVQADVWLEESAKRWFDGDVFASACAFAYAHGRDRGFFSRPVMQDRESALIEIGKWNAALAVTGEELKAAYDYAVSGNDAAAGEVAATKPAADGGAKPSVLDDIYDMLCEASACGLSRADCESVSWTELSAILLKWHRNAGGSMDRITARAHGEYIMTLAEITKAAELRKGAVNG
jgi:hypothetical protein